MFSLCDFFFSSTNFLLILSICKNENNVRRQRFNALKCVISFERWVKFIHFITSKFSGNSNMFSTKLKYTHTHTQSWKWEKKVALYFEIVAFHMEQINFTRFCLFKQWHAINFHAKFHTLNISNNLKFQWFKQEIDFQNFQTKSMVLNLNFLSFIPNKVTYCYISVFHLKNYQVINVKRLQDLWNVSVKLCGNIWQTFSKRHFHWIYYATYMCHIYFWIYYIIITIIAEGLLLCWNVIFFLHWNTLYEKKKNILIIAINWFASSD